MSVIHLNSRVHFSIAIPRGVRWAACGFAVGTLAMVATGPAVDYVRIQEFKSRLQSVATDAALSGALAYVNRGASDDAESAATDSFIANDDYRDGRIGTPMISVSATPSNMYGQNGYGVTVKLRGEIEKRFDLLSRAPETVTVTAVALNPVARPIAR